MKGTFKLGAALGMSVHVEKQAPTPRPQINLFDRFLAREKAIYLAKFTGRHQCEQCNTNSIRALKAGKTPPVNSPVTSEYLPVLQVTLDDIAHDNLHRREQGRKFKVWKLNEEVRQQYRAGLDSAEAEANRLKLKGDARNEYMEAARVRLKTNLPWYTMKDIRRQDPLDVLIDGIKLSEILRMKGDA